MHDRMVVRKVDGLITERAGGELLVYSDATAEAHALNETAALVFDLCDGATSPGAMAAEVARRSGLPADEAIVGLAISELVDAGLVVVDEPPSGGLTRRALIRRLGLTAAATAALPIVESIVAPSVAEAQSGPIQPTTVPP